MNFIIKLSKLKDFVINEINDNILIIIDKFIKY